MDTSYRNSYMEFGEVYFWTSTMVMWKLLLKKDKYKTVIIESLKELTKRKLIAAYGYVIMPNHVHFIWEMLDKNKKEMPDSSFTKFTAYFFKKDLATTILRFCLFLNRINMIGNISFGNVMH